MSYPGHELADEVLVLECCAARKVDGCLSTYLLQAPGGIKEVLGPRVSRHGIRYRRNRSLQSLLPYSYILSSSELFLHSKKEELCILQIKPHISTILVPIVHTPHFPFVSTLKPSIR